MSPLGETIRNLREKAGLTVRALAAALEKSPGYISRVEGRGEIPSPELLCKIADQLGVSPEKLLELAKQIQLERTAEDIEAKQRNALNLYRKGK